MVFQGILGTFCEFPQAVWPSQFEYSLDRTFAHSAVLPNFFLSPMYMFPARIESGWIMKKVISRILGKFRGKVW